MCNETGKSRKAQRRLEGLRQQTKDVAIRLGQAHDTLREILCEDAHATLLNTVRADCGEEEEGATALTRIVFGYDCSTSFHLYIDFRVLSDGDDIEGAIVYGALRDPCYPHSLWPNPNDKKEEKPLLRFSVNDIGRISTKGTLTDEWWLRATPKSAPKDARKAVSEMHYRALDCICRDALNWVNEPYLP